MKTWQHTPEGRVHGYRSDSIRALCGKTHEHYYGRTKPGWPRMVDRPVDCEACLALMEDHER